MLLNALSLIPLKPIVQICACTKYLALATCHNNAFYAVIAVEKCVCGFELRLHGWCEGIVVLWAVQGQDDDGRVARVVRCADLGEGEGVVGVW